MPEWVSIPGGIVVIIIGGYLSIRSMFDDAFWKLAVGIGLMLAGLLTVSLGVIYTLDTYGSEYTYMEVCSNG